ncbi:Histone-lysine N-methyltransferase protein [Dioscorea alata]|uniref:Histone-lysine N-methyltransferase protein n=1 Tax=Dioscorea alata TaxID=55571 RepID=A0ACB7WBD0_DIOAL|nr:Histone-lysine N-methyltransferase protein [Dioscorea alata]
MTRRRLRAFRRWMRSCAIASSDALEIVENASSGIAVKALCELREGDVVATIPKAACLTIRTSAARTAIEEAGIDGSLGLSFALMFERSLGATSKWFGYLQVLPEREEVPLVWSSEEVDRLLAGTELHKTVQEDQAVICEDWKEYIEPLIHSGPLELDPKFFGVDQYFSAKTLVASRSFQIDDYHGYGMVPLADLFNHKTGAENVHFTSEFLPSDSDEEDDAVVTDTSGNDQSPSVDLNTNSAGDSPVAQQGYNHDPASREHSDGDPDTLEMIIVRDVEAGAEVFNTYGLMGNAALLHRYGFTEPDNHFDIVNIDLNLILEWSSFKFSNRHSRVRLSLWRKLEFSPCASQDSEYFEISYDGEPQVELLVLLYIIFLPDDTYEKLSYLIDSFKDADEISKITKLTQITTSECSKKPDEAKELLLNRSVCIALLSLADRRESLYGSNSVEDDLNKLKTCCSLNERKLYHSLTLRICERTILAKLRAYASRSLKSMKRKR